MDAQQTRRALLGALESWKELSDEQKGKGFQDSASRLAEWADELEEKTA